MIDWPAIIHFAGDDELSFIADAESWYTNDSVADGRLMPSDRLIDGAGAVFTISNQAAVGSLPTPTGQRIALEELTALVRAHVSQLGHCCVSKLSFGTVAEAILAVPHYD